MALFAVLDVETTGLSPVQGDRVVEIAVVILDEQFRVVRMFDSLVNPKRSIPTQVTQIHGISNSAVRSAPTFANLLPGLMDCLSDVTHLVAHNISFDLGFLRSELSECGADMPQSFGRLCTMQIARRKRVAHNAKLSSVASALRIPTIALAHRAIVDAAVTARILSLLHPAETSVPHKPICWTNLPPSNGDHRQFPRGNPVISMQSLVHFGLTVAANTTMVPARRVASG
ncbi:MAG: 3'-5' exonuclease [Planctomycetota bacterium]|nr:3'-5' exonuclease [Planctomycetota bacterium]